MGEHGGLDSLLSMVRMLTGVPVACVAINGTKDAALHATQTLGSSMSEYGKRIAACKREMTEV